MSRFEQLLKEGKLAETLMADTEFVDGAKKIFAEEGKEVNDAKLLELMQNIEKACNEQGVLTKAELGGVSGGVNGKDIARNVIRVVSGLAGAAVGLVGSMTGLGALEERTGEEVGGAVGTTAIAVGAGAGALAADRFAEWVCKKAGL